MDTKELFELVNLVCSKSIAEFEIEHEGFRLKIVKPVAGQVAAETAAELRFAIENVAMGASPAAAAQAADEQDWVAVTSPIVGTFYRAPNPSAEPYAKVGDRVKKGQVLCIIEAMKLMNEIESEATGIVAEVCVETGQPVEYGEPLFKIRPER